MDKKFKGNLLYIDIARKMIGLVLHKSVKS